jgi:S1-C subfamily serine protease
MRRIVPSLLLVALCLASTVLAEEIAPRDLPERCTVAITAKAAGRGYFGTGSIISPLGYILTSTTVVPPKSTEINVVSPGHFKLKGVLVKADEKTELALIRVQPRKGTAFPALTIRDSATTKLGDVVMTVSNSFQVARNSGELSVSVGLLSGRYKLTKKLSKQPVYMGEAIETTAATNPGSDGGPLLDGSGQLIGVLSLNTSNARWLGVAVPINVTLPDLKKAIDADLKARKVGKTADDALSIATQAGTPLFPKWDQRAALFAAAAKKVAESVVAIKINRTKDDPRFTARTRIGRTGPGGGNLLGEMRKRPKGATVTGVIVGADGWIATSYFNIAGTLKSVKVVLADGKELAAKVVGWDQERDLALLKVEAAGLPAIEFSTEAGLGTDVCVLGRSPTATSLTLTSGIVSAVGRRDDSLLQFDAKANVGNTGGPLIGLDGKCLGIVGGISTNSRHGQNSGIAFAAWAAVLPKELAELKKGKKIKRRPRPFLGVVGAPGAVDLSGVLIARVAKGSPAEKAGLMRNDSILTIDGKKIEGVADLINIIRAKKPGDKVKLEVRRRSREMELTVTLDERR